MIDTATAPWIRTAADETAYAQGCRFDLARAERVRTFFRRFLRHSKGSWAGQPFELLDWQWLDVFAPLFGWIRPDGRRRFRRAYIEIPKKNGKSTMASGVALYMLVGDGEAGAEVFSTAVTREQAAIVHTEALNMVKASEALSAKIKRNESTGAMRYLKTASVYRILSHDAHAQEGKNPNCIIKDELHAWSGAAGRAFYNALTYASAARREPIDFEITTAGDDTLSVCYDRHEYARDIIRGTNRTDISTFAYIRAADPEDDIDDPATWRKANPSMGETIEEERFREELEQAKKKPAELASFKRYRLNIWVTGSNPALSPADWAACKREFNEQDLVGRECYAAIDLARTRDLTAIGLVFPEYPETDDTAQRLLSVRVLVYCFLPRGTLEQPETPPEFKEWERHGWLIVTEGDVTDYAAVEAKLLELHERFHVRELCYDPHFAEELTQRVSEATGIERVAFGQTILNFAAPTAEFERLVIAHQLHHDGNPCLAWQAGNVEWKTDANGNKRPVKPKDVKKVDAIVCLIMGVARAMLGGGQGRESGCLVI